MIYKKMSKNVLGLWNSPASRDLFSILSGHQLNAPMRATHSSVSTLCRVVSSGSGPLWRERPRRHTWQQCVNGQLAKLGWNIEAPWIWQHPTCGRLDMQNGDNLDANICINFLKVGEGLFMQNGSGPSVVSSLTLTPKTWSTISAGSIRSAEHTRKVMHTCVQS